MKTNQITVVIATLGKKNINKLLKKLIDNNLIKEILISIPNSKNKIIDNYKNKKVKIVKSKFKHQVKQRIICYKKIKTKYTLLLDDDVSFNSNFILDLLKTNIKKGNNTVIGPIYYNNKNLQKIHSMDMNLQIVFKRILQSVIFGIDFSKKRMGKISKAGTCYGVDPEYMNEDCIKVEWIPGGCMMLRTKNLISKNYFNVKGKAYCEDLIQSYLLRKKKLKLYICKKTKIYTDIPQKLIGKDDLKDYLNGHYLFCKHSNLFNFRVSIWRAYLNLKLLLSKMF